MSFLLFDPIGWFVLFFALLIGVSVIWQILVALGFSSGQMSQAVTAFQEERLNTRWRICLIPIDDSGRIRGQAGSLTTLVWSLGGLAFIGGAACLLLQKTQLAIGLLATTVVVGVGTLLLQFIRRRLNVAGWQFVSARCLDREVRQVVMGSRGMGRPRYRWMCRIICEYKRGGATQRLTPMIRVRALGDSERAFRSEQKLNAYLDAAIDTSGNCKLRVNPINPLDAELHSA
jgi:hypothetical protein